MRKEWIFFGTLLLAGALWAGGGSMDVSGHVLAAEDVKIVVTNLSETEQTNLSCPAYQCHAYSGEKAWQEEKSFGLEGDCYDVKKPLLFG